MSLRTKIDVGVIVGFDNACDDTAFERSLTEMLDTCERVTTQTIQLAASEANTQISLGDVAQARMLYLEADGEIVYRIDGTGNQARTLSRMVQPSSTQAPNLKAYVLTTEVFSSLYVSNPSSTEVRRLKICIVGDLVT